MIVADANLVAYLILQGERTETSRRVFAADPGWAAPILWRSEFRSVLTSYIRARRLSVAVASTAHEKAAELFAGREHLIAADPVLHLAARSKCSAYDCEYVALAQQLGVPLVTWDRQVLHEFPELAVAPENFLRG